MTRIVCLVCDALKPYAERLDEPSTCLECGHITPNRAVGEDGALIAPGSALRFRDQREIFNNERKRA